MCVQLKHASGCIGSAYVVCRPVALARNFNLKKQPPAAPAFGSGKLRRFSVAAQNLETWAGTCGEQEGNVKTGGGFLSIFAPLPSANKEVFEHMWGQRAAPY